MNGFRSDETLLGDLATGQLTRLCQVAGLSEADTAAYTGVLIESLGASAGRPLALPPPSRTFLSDDHSPVEFSLAFLPGRAPGLRVLVEPGCSRGDDLAENGRAGLRAVHAMADRWGFSTGQLDRLEDLFFPTPPRARWPCGAPWSSAPAASPGSRSTSTPRRTAPTGPPRRYARRWPGSAIGRRSTRCPGRTASRSSPWTSATGTPRE
ncbi:hypothetical protein SANTM175S_03899 [Streptomyces antimycoticus]